MMQGKRNQGAEAMRAKVFVKGFALLALLWLSAPAYAAEVTLTWQYPTQYCDGEALPIESIQKMEIYISETEIPRVPGPCGTEQDVPPSGAIIQQVVTPETSVTVELTCGKTYYFVGRIQASNLWSNFSAEAMRIVDCSRPGVPIIISLT
jgi:hypothetical protein